VNTFTDLAVPTDGLLSLRAAIALAADPATHAGDDTIVVPHEIDSVVGTYRLSLGSLSVSDDSGMLSIMSDGGPATIDVQRAGSVFEVSPGTEVVFQGLTITGGFAHPGSGGGIYNLGTASIIDSTVMGNDADYGGAIYNLGALTLSNSTVNENGSKYGGGIYNGGTATLTLTDSTVTTNSAVLGDGGGIWNGDTATADVINSFVNDNFALLHDGGGIWNGSTATITVTGGTLSNNAALVHDGGGIWNAGTATIATSMLCGNLAGPSSRIGVSESGSGGGIYNLGSVTITGGTFSGNLAEFVDGGAIWNGGAATITDVAFNDNSAQRAGGGIWNSGAVTISGAASILSANMANDSGGAIYNVGTASMSDCTITDSHAVANGGGIWNGGTFNITGSTLNGNSAAFRSQGLGEGQGEGGGGGIWNKRTLTISDSILSENKAADCGGGIYNAGDASVSDSTVTGNEAVADGGGIFNRGAMTITGSASILSVNKAAEAGGGFCNSGTATITDITLRRNEAIDGDGGAIWNGYSLTLVDSVLDGNSAAVGGGIVNVGEAEITRCMLTGNAADFFGGGIWNGGSPTPTLTVTSSTISGNTGEGVYLRNLPGAQSLGSTKLLHNIVMHNTKSGVLFLGDFLQSAADYLIGSPLAGNTISSNGRAGVAVVGSTSAGITIRGNLIYGNAGLGIDLGNDGLTPNSPGGPHNGPNHLQNFPLLVSANSNGASTTLAGALNSAPNKIFLIDCYASPLDGSDQTYLGATAVLTDTNGNALFSATLPQAVPAGWIVTATATTIDTAPYGDTSEFSPGVVATAPAARASNFVVSRFPSPATAGTSGTITVTARLADGTTATGFSGTVHFTSSDLQAVLPADYTFTTADGGVHTFSATLKTAGSQSITASDTAVSDCAGTMAGITVNPAAASRFTVGAFPSPVAAGVAGSFTVTAWDAYGNRASGYTGKVHFTSSDPQAALPADYTFSPADGGVHAFSATLRTAGSQSITTSDEVITDYAGTQAGISVSPAAASRLTVVGFPAAITAGAAGNFSVTAWDDYGNPASGYAGTVHFTSSDLQSVLPADYTFTVADGGVHAFSATLKTAGSQSVSATDSGLTNGAGTLAGITVNAALASSITVAGFPSEITAGAAGSFSLTAWDAYGNRASRYTGTVQFTSSDAKAVLPGKYTFTAADGGIHNFSATLKTAGYQSLTAADTTNGALSGAQGSILVKTAAASRLVLNAPASVRAGAKLSLTVTVLDAFGNVVVGYRGTIAFRSSDSTASLPKNFTFTAADQGVHTFAGLALKKKGKQSITVTDTQAGSLTASVFVEVL
jgi:hypothetical protein